MSAFPHGSLTIACGPTALTRWWPAMCCENRARCSRASVSCCGRREFSFGDGLLGERPGHARAFASGACPIVVTYAHAGPIAAAGFEVLETEKSCFARRTSLSQQEKVNEHRSADLARACAQTKYLLTMGTRLSSAETAVGERADEQRREAARRKRRCRRRCRCRNVAVAQ